MSVATRKVRYTFTGLGRQRLVMFSNRVKAGIYPALPTPPYMRVRIRQFIKHSET